MLRRDKPQGFSEHAVCLVLDEVIRILLACHPNNSLHLMDHQAQSLEYLKIHLSFFNNNSNFEQSDLVRQFIAQNNMYLSLFEQANHDHAFLK
jgi:hypothetical protein